MNAPKFSIFLMTGLAILLFSACGDDDCLQNESTFTWSENKSIEIDPAAYTEMIGDSLVDVAEYLVVDGQDILLKYKEVNRLCDDDIADGLSITEFLMVIPADSTNTFSYTNSEIIATSAFVKNFDAPLQLAHQSVEEGEIIGTKIDENSWQVSIDIVAKLQMIEEVQGANPKSINIDAIFILE